MECYVRCYVSIEKKNRGRDAGGELCFSTLIYLSIEGWLKHRPSLGNIHTAHRISYANIFPPCYKLAKTVPSSVTATDQHPIFLDVKAPGSRIVDVLETWVYWNLS
jgi:hypothetical protein